MDFDQHFEGFTKPPVGRIVIDPFAGDGLKTQKWLGDGYITLLYDKVPPIHSNGVFQRDSLLSNISYQGAYVVTKPPWFTKDNPKVIDQTVFNTFGCDNMYKAFLRTLIRQPPIQGYIILPLSFLNGTQENEQNRRHDFFQVFCPQRINVFYESIPSVAIQFIHRLHAPSEHKHEILRIHFYPSKESSLLHIENKKYKSLPGSDPFTHKLKEPCPKKFRFYKLTEQTQVKKNETILSTLWLQSSDRTFRKAGLYDTEPGRRIVIRGVMGKKTQERLAHDFNKFIQEWRTQTNSLFLLYQDPINPALGRIPFKITHAAIARILWSYYRSSDRTSVQIPCRVQSSSQS